MAGLRWPMMSSNYISMVFAHLAHGLAMPCKLAIILNEGCKVCLLLLQHAIHTYAALHQAGWSRHSNHLDTTVPYGEGPCRPLDQQWLQTSM